MFVATTQAVSLSAASNVAAQMIEIYQGEVSSRKTIHHLLQMLTRDITGTMDPGLPPTGPLRDPQRHDSPAQLPVADPPREVVPSSCTHIKGIRELQGWTGCREG